MKEIVWEKIKINENSKHWIAKLGKYDIVIALEMGNSDWELLPLKLAKIDRESPGFKSLN